MKRLIKNIWDCLSEMIISTSLNFISTIERKWYRTQSMSMNLSRQGMNQLNPSLCYKLNTKSPENTNKQKRCLNYGLLWDDYKAASYYNVFYGQRVKFFI